MSDDGRVRHPDPTAFEKFRLKPHRKSQWVIPPDASAGFVAAMEDVLETYQKPREASRLGELHPGPLSEPYVRLSPHTAPIRRTRPQARPRFAAHTASSLCRLSGDAATRSNPFAPVPLQNLHRYYGSVRPSPLLRYSRLAVFAACASPLASEAWFLQFRAKACVRLTPPLRRSPSAQSSGSRRTCPRRLSRPWFRRHLSS